MYRAKRLTGVGLGVALLASLILGGSVLAQETERVELQLTPSRDSGVRGTATITEVENGVTIELDMRGLPEAGIKHINHFHLGGTCSDDRAGNPAPATIPLKTIVAQGDGTGSGTTTLEDVTLAQLFDVDKQRYLAFHSQAAEGEAVPPVISCADIVQTAGGGAAVGALPGSGGMSPMVLLSAGVALILGAGLLLALRR